MQIKPSRNGSHNEFRRGPPLIFIKRGNQCRGTWLDIITFYQSTDGSSNRIGYGFTILSLVNPFILRFDRRSVMSFRVTRLRIHKTHRRDDEY